MLDIRIGEEKGGKSEKNAAGENTKIGINFKTVSESRVSMEDRDSQLFFENLVWMTSDEAAKYLRKSYGALRVMVCLGYIKPRIFKRRWYFKRNELDRLIEGSL